MLYVVTFLLFFTCVSAVGGQSRRVVEYSEGVFSQMHQSDSSVSNNQNEDVLRVETELITFYAQALDSRGNLLTKLAQKDFRILENEELQDIAYFSDDDQPFTVALVLDMSYSSVFKLQEIQAAALAFISQLRQGDRVMIVSFDEKVRVLCEPTNNQKALRLAIEGSKIASGTSLLTALDVVLREKMTAVKGRKAVILLGDGVDTTSKDVSAANVLQSGKDSGALIYSIKYNTFGDVQKTRKNSAQVYYDADDRPYIVEQKRTAGERESDYERAENFLKNLVTQNGGRIYSVSSDTNLNKAFSSIAEELRKTYSFGYYPSRKREKGQSYETKIRIQRPQIKIRLLKADNLRE